MSEKYLPKQTILVDLMRWRSRWSFRQNRLESWILLPHSQRPTSVAQPRPLRAWPEKEFYFPPSHAAPKPSFARRLFRQFWSREKEYGFRSTRGRRH